jgi:acetoin utilization deacetylase AcuC-like enzyme
VPAGTGEAAFLSLIEHVVMPVGRRYRPDLILISAGYDAHRRDPLGGLTLDTASFAGMSSRMRALGQELGAPVGAVLEGGYDLEALADSVAETMAALERGVVPSEVARHPLAEDAIDVLGRYWDF